MTLSLFRQSDLKSGVAAHEQAVRGHYTQPGLRDAILRGLALDTSTAATIADDLGTLDEFHIGGRDATLALASQLALRSDMRLLDVGCGLGGTARSLAVRYRCQVDGVDLVPEFVAVGSTLNEVTDLSSLVRLQVGRATAIPFSNRRFDRCLVLHVGMNVPDKRRMMEEIHRVLKPGGLLGLYEVMRVARGDLEFPLPWASSSDTSFVASPAEYAAALDASGLELIAVRNRFRFGLRYFRRMQCRLAGTDPPPLGLHLLMGTDAAVKIDHALGAFESGTIAPIEVIARRTDRDD